MKLKTSELINEMELNNCGNEKANWDKTNWKEIEVWIGISPVKHELMLRQINFALILAWKEKISACRFNLLN